MRTSPLAGLAVAAADHPEKIGRSWPPEAPVAGEEQASPSVLRVACG